MRNPQRKLIRAWNKVGDYIIHSHLMWGRKGGIPAVLLHGLGAAGDSFLPLMRAMATRFSPIVAPDLPAHGRSSAPHTQLTALEAYAGLAQYLIAMIAPKQPVLLVGNSLGGAYAVNFALDFPERVRGLYLISPAGAPFESSLSYTLSQLRPQSLGQTSADNPKMQAVRSLIASFDNNICFKPDDLSGLKPPVHLVWGQKDTVLPSNQRAFYRSHLPESSSTQEPPHFGHCPQFKYASELAEGMAQFTKDW